MFSFLTIESEFGKQDEENIGELLVIYTVFTFSILSTYLNSNYQISSNLLKKKEFMIEVHI